MDQLFNAPPYWRWPTLADYRAIDTFVPPPLADINDPPRLIAHAVHYGFQLDEDIDPERLEDLEPARADRIVADAANLVQGNRLVDALDSHVKLIDKDPQQQAIWEAVVEDGRPLFLPANPLVNFFDTESFMQVVRLRRSAGNGTWNFIAGQDPAELGLPHMGWQHTRTVSPTLRGGLRSARAWIAERTREEFRQRTEQFREAAMERLSFNWATPGLSESLDAVPDFSGYDGEEDPEAIAGGLAGEEDHIRYAVRKFGGRVYLGVFDPPEGRRQYLAPAQDLPLSEAAGPEPVASDSGVSGWFFQFPFTALDEWWAKVGVWAAAERMYSDGNI